MPANQCLSPGELRDFVLGQTDDDRSEEILVHLAECPACEDTVASLDDTADSLVVSVRQAVEPDDVEAEDASDPLAAALASVRSRFAPSVSDPPVDESMSRIIERVRDYELVDELGSGGMGTVYKAVHTKLDRTVALKLLPARRLRDRGAVSRFEREMKAIGRLDHPAIVRATDAGEVDGTHFLAMDFVDGIDLGKLVRLVGPLDVASACELIRQAAIGLHYAHEQGLIHRDVKPSNLMVERGQGLRAEGQEPDKDPKTQSAPGPLTLSSQPISVRILDLGLALFGSASEAVDELTTVGQLMGTLDYMAPEQADNSHSVDARADIYSLGATLFKLLTGMAPYETAERCSPLQKMKALATTDPPAIASRREEVPDNLAAVVDRMLLRDPDERFQSAAEVAEALAPFCDGVSIGSLVERGLQREARERQLQNSHLAPRDEPLAASGSNGQPPTRATATTDRSQRAGSNPQLTQRRSSSRGARWLLWTALTAVALLAGITIWIQTDTGTLKIECADENVPIEIRNSNGKVVSNETLSVGQNEIVIRSGSYEIVLPKDYDELKVENGKYELTRGGEWIARVTKQQSGSTLRVESPDAAAASMNDSVGIPQKRATTAGGADVPESRATVATDPFAPAVIPQILFDIHVWEIDEKKLESLGNTQDEQGSRLDALLSELGVRYIDLKALAKNPSVGLSNNDVTASLRKLVDAEVASTNRDELKLQVASNKTGPIDFSAIWGKRLDLTPRPVNSKLQLDLAFNVTQQDRVPQQAESTQSAALPMTPVKPDNFEATLSMDWGESVLLIDRNHRPGWILLLTLKPELMSAQTPERIRSGAIPLASPPARSKPSQPNLVFSGRTFEQWRQSVLTERNPEELKNAVMALCILGRQNRDREAAETVLKVTDAYPCEISSSPEGELIAAAIRYLRTLDADAIVPALVEALKDRGTNTRRVIVEHLAAGVMYGHVGGGPGGGAGISIPNTGKAEPLQSRLVKSPEYRKTLVELFPKFAHNDLETSTLRYVAFQQIEGFLDDASLKTEIDGLLEDIFRKRDTVRIASTTPGPFYLPRAIRHLTRRSPRPELAAYFLDNLERTYPNAPTESSAAWLPSYSSDWYGLWLLGDKAKAESDRIAKLLTAKLPGTYHPSPVQATTVPTTVAGWRDTNSPRQWVTRKVLVLDLLATIGPGAESAIPAVIDEIEALTGQRPVDDGEYGYEANDPRTFFVQFEAPFSHGLSGNVQTSGGFGWGGGFGGGVPGIGGGFISVSDDGPEIKNREPSVMPEPWLRLNAALRALKSLTGKTPRFAVLQLGLKQPDDDVPGKTKAISYASGGYGFAPSVYESSQQGKNKDYDFGQAYGNGWVPKLVSYRGKHFDEWAETDLTSLSATELNHVQRGIELVGGYEPGPRADAFARIFDTAMRLPGDVAEADRKVIHDAFLNCWLSNDGPARGKLLQAIFGGTPERTALVLTEIVAPSLDLTKSQPTSDLTSESPAPLNIEWAAPNAITRELIFAGPFGSRYQSLVDGWDKHGPELRAAILHVEAQFPALKQVNRTDLLQKLIDGGSPQEKLAAALVVARIDLSKQKNAPPRARNRDKTFTETPALKQSLKQAAIEALVEAIRERQADVDWVNAVPALLTLQHGKLDDKLALEFVGIIEADSSSPESVQPFSLTIGSPPSGGTGDEAGGIGNPFGAAIRGLGLPGMDLGTPSGGDEDKYAGTGSGPAGAAGLGSGGYSGASGYGMAAGGQAKPPEAVHRVLSRRILLLELLTLTNRDNAELKMRLAEVIRKITSQQKPYQGLPLSANAFTSELAGFWQNSATFRGTGPATADVESNTFAGVMIRAPIVLGIPTKDLKPDGKQPEPDAAASADPPSAGTSVSGMPGNGPPQATYQGRTYDDWFDDVRRERSPSELISGLEALVTLGAGKHDEDITRQILAIVTRLNVAAADGGSNEALLSATERYLNRLKPEVAVPLLTEAVRSANPAVIWYATQRLMPDLSIRKWNAIETKTTGPVSLALYQNAEFRDALLAAWPKITTEMRPQYVLAASLFADAAPPDGELPDTELLKFLADVAGGEDTATQVPLKGAIRSSLKLHACRALARIYPSCPELPKWTLDGIEPFRDLTGSEWWYHTCNGWLALVQMGRHAAGQTERLAEWIVDTDEPYRSVVDYAWVITLESGMKDVGGLAIPGRLVMLEVLTATSDAEELTSAGRKSLQSIIDKVPEFAAAALGDERSVKRADDEFAQDVEVSALDTLLLPYRGRGSVRMLNFGFGSAEISSLDGAKLVVAHRRCQKLIRDLLGETTAEASQSEPD
ncbi:MAG: protein kinase domain-containing protein [Planctomycetota bacterium]